MLLELSTLTVVGYGLMMQVLLLLALPNFAPLRLRAAEAAAHYCEPTSVPLLAALDRNGGVHASSSCLRSLINFFILNYSDPKIYFLFQTDFEGKINF